MARGVDFDVLEERRTHSLCLPPLVPPPPFRPRRANPIYHRSVSDPSLYCYTCAQPRRRWSAWSYGVGGRGWYHEGGFFSGSGAGKRIPPIYFILLLLYCPGPDEHRTVSKFPLQHFQERSLKMLSV